MILLLLIRTLPLPLILSLPSLPPSWRIAKSVKRHGTGDRRPIPHLLAVGREAVGVGGGDGGCEDGLLG